MPILEQVREHVETDLSDDALGRVISDAVTEVESRFGDDTEKTVTRVADGRYIKLLRPAISITSVAEQRGWATTPETLDPTDYMLIDGGRTLVRIGSSDWGDVRWNGIYTIVYMPVVEIDVRDRVVIDLVRLELSYNGAIKNQSIGDYGHVSSLQPESYQRERENLLAGVSHRRGFRIL